MKFFCWRYRLRSRCSYLTALVKQFPKLPRNGFDKLKTDKWCNRARPQSVSVDGAAFGLHGNKLQQKKVGAENNDFNDPIARNDCRPLLKPFWEPVFGASFVRHFCSARSWSGLLSVVRGGAVAIKKTVRCDWEDRPSAWHVGVCGSISNRPKRNRQPMPAQTKPWRPSGIGPSLAP